MAALLLRIWKYGRWVLVAIALAYVALVLYRIPAVREKQRSDETVAKIHAQRLTMNDVDGNHLPPPPDPAQKDATIAGVDANQNGIRDDVELAIFAKYPGQSNLKLRAAELQYAKAIQGEFAYANNVETLKAVMEEEGRAALCLLDTAKSKEVETLAVNTTQRKEFRETVRSRYMSSFGTPSVNECDIDPATF